MASDLHYDIRSGAEDGPIVYSGTEALTTSSSAPWSTETAGVSADAAAASNGFFPGVAAGARFSIDLEGGSFDLAFAQAEAVAPAPGLGAVGRAALAAALLGVGWALRFSWRRRRR